MESSRLKNTFRNTFFGIGYNCFNVIGQFAVRTLLVWKLGNEYVGLNSLFTSILSVLNMSELGIGSAMCYSMYRPIAEHDQKKINALTNLYRGLCKIIGLIILVMGLIFLPFIGYFVEGEVPGDINIYLLYLVFLLDTLISYFLFAYQTAVIDAFQRNDIQSKVLFVSNAFMYIAQIIVLLITNNYWYYIIIMPISKVIENILRTVIVKKKFPDVYCEGIVEDEQKHEIKRKVLALFGHRLNGTVINSADNIVISSFLGLTMVGLYNNYYYILMAVTTPFGAFYSAVRSSIGNSYVKESCDKNYDLFLKIMFAIKWMAAWFGICLLCLYQPFITLWVGQDSLLGISTVVLLSLMFYEWRIFDCITVFKDAAGLWWEDRIRPYVACIANVVINVILVNIWGINGVIVSTVLTRLLISFPWITQVLFKNVFRRNALEFYWEYIKSFLVSFFVALLTYWICSFANNSWGGFIVKVLICALLPNLCFALIYGRRNEFKFYKNLATKKLNSLKK